MTTPPHPHHPMPPVHPPQQQYGAPPAFAPGPTQVGSHTGFSWLMGLGVLLFVPFLSSVLAAVLMAVMSRSEAKRATTDIGRRNAHRAGNWGITYGIITVIWITGHFVGLYLLDDSPVLDGFLPYGWIILSWLVISLFHVVISVVGFFVARRGKPMPVTGIPFFR